jgi:hypothetical protein
MQEFGRSRKIAQKAFITTKIKAMTEIQEGNKLIAEFMGFEEKDAEINVPHPAGSGLIRTCYVDGYKYWRYAEDENKNETTIHYHTSWDWLMPVLLKISDIHYPDYWNGRQPDDVGEWDNCAYPRTFGMRDKDGNYMVRLNANVLFSAPTLIEATWLAVTNFITDYNQNKISKL